MIIINNENEEVYLQCLLELQIEKQQSSKIIKG